MRKLQWTIEDLTTSEEAKKLDWVPSLNLKKGNRSNILNDEELYDLHAITAMNLLQKDKPIIVQPPSLMYATGVDYCPFETVQVAHNGAHHLLLLSFMKGTIYDSLNMRPTDILLNQITQLFSPDEAMPAYKRHRCHKQLGSTDCDVFAIAYASDVLLGNEPEKNRYEQSKMREHIVNCFELGKLTPFPKYRTEDKFVSSTSDNKPNNPDNS